jgi:hypothetical protein
MTKYRIWTGVVLALFIFIQISYYYIFNCELWYFWIIIILGAAIGGFAGRAGYDTGYATGYTNGRKDHQELQEEKDFHQSKADNAQERLENYHV